MRGRTSTTGIKALRAFLDEGTARKIRQYGAEFYLEEEQEVYEFVKEHLDQFGVLPSVDTVKEHHSLPDPLPEPTEYYEGELRRRRVFNHFGEHWAELKAAVGERDVDGCAVRLREMLAGVTGLLQPNQFSTLAEVTGQVVADYQYAKNHPGMRGVTFGWDTLDAYTLGAQGGDLIVVAGRTGMGKSSMLVKMAHSAWLAGHSVLFTSMEMTLVPIARRWIGVHTGINPRFIRAGELGRYAEQKLVTQCNEMTGSGASVYFQSGDFQKNVASVEALMEEFDTDAVYIDAAYLLSPEGQKRGFVSKWESIATVVQELKKVALKHNKPIIISVQMNRNVKKATTRELDTSDIGGSDSIPQDASVVLGLRQGPSPYVDTTRVIQVMKNRDGEEGNFLVNHRYNPVDFNEADAMDGVVDVDVNWMANGV
jgi:replicative DNA helicase